MGESIDGVGESIDDAVEEAVKTVEFLGKVALDGVETVAAQAERLKETEPALAATFAPAVDTAIVAGKVVRVLRGGFGVL